MKTTYGIRSWLVYAPGLGSLLLATCLSSIALGQVGGGGMGMGMGSGGGMDGVTGMPGGMGGMGGGGMPGIMGGPMGGMGGVAGGYYPGAMPALPLVTWSKPEGEKPQWLISGSSALKATESLRRALDKSANCEFNEIPLNAALSELLSPADIAFELNATELESFGLSVEQPVTLIGKGSVRELLRRILSAKELSYVVHEDYVEITSGEAAKNSPVIRTYDLSYIMPNNQGVTELTQCIQLTIEPSAWENSEATMSPLGSLLVVRCTEEIHHEIAKLLTIRSLAPVVNTAGQAAVDSLPLNNSSLGSVGGIGNAGSSGLPDPNVSAPNSTNVDKTDVPKTNNFDDRLPDPALNPKLPSSDPFK
jgi:hypothetical protein